ncbi:MAG: GTPase domain-containing protein [Desulfobacteraceae bacterium]|nr:GTPase domain-containing protein [Desulfobacteraceae bacterium]
MAVIYIQKKEVQIKIVYFGPGRGGKTTNLEYIFRTVRHKIQSDLVSINTHGDRTLFFDFLPLDFGQIYGYNVKIQLYTVPGQVKYNATRKIVLKGVDGVVFVADSMAVMKEKNIQSIKNLEENLAFYDIDIFDNFPIIVQYNKRDLASSGIPLLDIKALEKDLNTRLNAPYFEASALKGHNVIPTIKKAISRTMVSLQDQLV